MRYALFGAALAALAGQTLAQDLSGIPGCALVCALAAGKKAGCTSGDVKCFCSSGAALSQAQACVQSSCSESDAKKAIAGAQKLCDSVGVAPAVEARSSPAGPTPAAGGNGGSGSQPSPAPAGGAAAGAAGAAAATSGSTSCSTLSSKATGSYPAAAASTTSKPATFTGGAASNACGAGAALAGVAFAVAAAL